MNYIKFFTEITLADVSIVGGKTASLGQMIQGLADKNVRIPPGFAITADAYRAYVEANNLTAVIAEQLKRITDYSNMSCVQAAGKAIREHFVAGTVPDVIANEIKIAYEQVCRDQGQPALMVAVRSSATAEDLPTASFAGQQETFLQISGIEAILDACKKCFASLFTDRAIVYRHEQKFEHLSVALSIAIQKMVRSDRACSGVAFSLETESGFKDVVVINASWGLGEAIVQGMVVPDEYVVFKPTLQKGYQSIVKKECGKKAEKIVYGERGPVSVSVASADQQRFCLSDQEIAELARMVCTIESYYTDLKRQWCPMDIEWAKDGSDGKLYIVQARPETVHSHEKSLEQVQYTLSSSEAVKTLISGHSIGNHIVSGTVRIMRTIEDSERVQKGDIIVADMTDPDWIPALQKAVGIVTERGGRTCHAAIVARELRIPAIVGAEHALSVLHEGMTITLDCSRGTLAYVYEGNIPYTRTVTTLDEIPVAPADIMINLADPDRAFALAPLPVSGIGLARIEFIIANHIKVHPLALIHEERITDQAVRDSITRITAAYSDKKEFFTSTLAYGIATIAAAFYPRSVIVRLSDFKTNEYRNLVGGVYFEPIEENPMIGFRGAVRYYSPHYAEGFALECQAIKRVRDDMGLTNVTVMIPFVRTIAEGKRVIAEMARHGLRQHENGLAVIMMCEVPSNVMLIDEFLKVFDGISIGSNDLTQLTLGVDRDSSLLGTLFDERDAAMKKMFELAIAGARRAHKYSGICGQAPSDFPELAEYLIQLGITSISLTPDSVIPFLMRYKK